MASKPLFDTKFKDKEKEIIKEIHKEKSEKEHKEFIKDLIKDKPEKEHKDKDKEHKEFKEKELVKDKPEKEHKDKDKDKDKDIEKIQKDKDKDIEKVQKDKDVEKVQKDKDKDAEVQPGGGGDPAAAHALFKFQGKEHIEKTHKDVEKVQKDKDIETAAQPVGAAQAAHKIAEKFAEKVFVEKTHKEFKFEKLEKFEKHEKFEIKEWDVAGPVKVGPGDPVEQRMAALEATVAQLMHFIPAEMRPNLSTGALAQEEGTKGAQGSKSAPAAEKADPQADKGKK